MFKSKIAIFALILFMGFTALATEPTQSSQGAADYLIHKIWDTLNPKKDSFEMIKYYTDSGACQQLLRDHSLTYKGNTIKGNFTRERFAFDNTSITEVPVIFSRLGRNPKEDVADNDGRLKIWRENQRITHVQELAHTDDGDIAVTQFDFKYNKDGYCIPQKMSTFKITPSHEIKDMVNKFDYSLCENGKAPGCNEPAIALAKFHLSWESLVEWSASKRLVHDPGQVGYMFGASQALINSHTKTAEAAAAIEEDEAVNEFLNTGNPTKK